MTLSKNNITTPLYIAAQEGKFDVAKLLIDSGADVDQATTYGETPLYIAAQNGHTALAQLLIEKGANVDQVDNCRKTPLYVAAEEGKLDVAKLLIKAGADVHLAHTYGKTPLLIALQNGQLDVAQLLLDNEADVNQVDNYGKTPLYIAAEKGKLDVAKLLLGNEADVNKAMPDGATPLFIAALFGRTATAQLLLFATKLSTRPDVGLRSSQTMKEDPIIRQILGCDQKLFRVLRNNLNLIAKADKARLSNSPSTSNTTTEPINTSQIALKALYEHFVRGDNLPQLLKTFIARTSPDQINRFNLNDPQSLLPKLSEKGIPTEIYTNIAQYVGLKALLEAHFNGEEAKDLTTVAAEADTAKALTQEGVLAVEDAKPDYLAELIAKLNVLLESNLPDNITKNDDGTYTYHYDAGNVAAEMAEKPLNKLTESELTELNSQIEARLTSQQAAQEAGGQAEEITQDDLSHVARLAEKRAKIVRNQRCIIS